MVGKESEIVTNELSGQSAELTPEAVAVYDCIRGAELLGRYDTMRKGLDWFMEYYPKEYMILLD